MLLFLTAVPSYLDDHRLAFGVPRVPRFTGESRHAVREGASRQAFVEGRSGAVGGERFRGFPRRRRRLLPLVSHVNTGTILQSSGHQNK